MAYRVIGKKQRINNTQLIPKSDKCWEENEIVNLREIDWGRVRATSARLAGDGGHLNETWKIRERHPDETGIGVF